MSRFKNISLYCIKAVLIGVACLLIGLVLGVTFGSLLIHLGGS